MIVTEKLERDCCQYKDLRPLNGMVNNTANRMMNGRNKEFMFCVHCGRHHEYTRYMDAAGSSEWEYRPMKWPWEDKSKFPNLK